MGSPEGAAYLSVGRKPYVRRVVIHSLSAVGAA